MGAVETRASFKNVVLFEESAALAAAILYSVIVAVLSLVNISSAETLEISLSSFALSSPLGFNPTLFEVTGGTALFRPSLPDVPIGINFASINHNENSFLTHLYLTVVNENGETRQMPCVFDEMEETSVIIHGNKEQFGIPLKCM